MPTDHQAPSQEDAVATAATINLAGTAAWRPRRSKCLSRQCSRESRPERRCETCTHEKYAAHTKPLVTKEYVVSDDRGRGVDVTTTGAVTADATRAPRAEERRHEIKEEFNDSSSR